MTTNKNTKIYLKNIKKLLLKRIGARRAEGELLIETRERIITNKTISKIYFIYFCKFLHTYIWSKM